MITDKEKSKIGHRFKEIRNMLSMTQVEFSEKLDVTQASLSQLEKGQCLPNFKFQKKLAEQFPDINFNWLLSGDGSPLRHDEEQKIKKITEDKTKKKIETDLLDKINILLRENEKLKDSNNKLIEILHGKKKK
jgi:DNA-binding XRE family transcriptional regulator